MENVDNINLIYALWQLVIVDLVKRCAFDLQWIIGRLISIVKRYCTLDLM